MKDETPEATPRLPAPPFVGLYGSHGGDWRDVCARLLDEAGVRWYDPTDRRWDRVTHGVGDRFQALVDELVADQHEGLLGAACVVFFLSSNVRYFESRTRGDDDGSPLGSHAARCELGFLAGRGITTFAVIDPEAEGRNYLWSYSELYPHVGRCSGLEEACRKAAAYVGG